MSVLRFDINRCVGCGLCYEICPQDVFRMNAELKKSVIAYPEDCINCQQCFVNCPGKSLAIAPFAYNYTLNSVRPAPKDGFDHSVFVPIIEDS